METLYIALVDTPGIFASMIRSFIKNNYIHVVISLNPEFTQAYSFGRRNPSIPFFAGFEKENSHEVLKAFPNAKYKIFPISCTMEQKTNVKQELEDLYKKRFKYHYTILGLPFILFQKEFHQKNHYTCSSYTASLLSRNDIHQFNKHFSLVTPRDFYELSMQTVIFEGLLREYINISNENTSYNHLSEITYDS